MKLKCRFYVGSRSILDNDSEYVKETLGEALDHARAILEEDPDRREVAVVQIIRVVRRKSVPIEVVVVT